MMDTVIIAFESDILCQRFSEMLESSGVAYCLSCHSGDVVRRILSAQRVQCVVCGYKLADGPAEELFSDLPQTCPMLMVANQGQLDLCGNPDIFKLAAPVGRGDIVSSVRMLMQFSDRLERYVRPKRNEEEQKTISEAKALLMARHGMTEDQAHRLLQKRSMDTGARMVQTARLVLEGN